MHVIIICIDMHIISCSRSAQGGLSLNAPGYDSFTTTHPSADDSMCFPFCIALSSNRWNSIGSMYGSMSDSIQCVASCIGVVNIIISEDNSSVVAIILSPVFVCNLCFLFILI